MTLHYDAFIHMYKPLLLAGSTGASPQLMYKPTGHPAQANLSVVPDGYAAER